MSRSPFLRRFAVGLAASAALLGALGAHAEGSLRIGFQKSSTLLTIVKAQGTLERELGRRMGDPGVITRRVGRFLAPSV